MPWNSRRQIRVPRRSNDGVEVNTDHPSIEPESRAYVALKELIQAGRPLIYIRSPEEARVHQLLADAARRLFRTEVAIWSWSLTDGLRRPDGAAATTEPLSARGVLDFIATHDAPAIFHLKDFHEFLRDAADIRRRLRDLYECCLDTGKFVVLSSPLRVIPQELDRQLVFMELHTPDLGELLAFLQRQSAKLAGQGVTVDSREELLFQMARALQGLTLAEAHHALRRALAVKGKLDHEALPQLLEEKKLLVNKSGLIEYVADGTQLAHVGGLEYLKKWLLERRKLFLERESLAAEIVPKGLLVMGVSGCGKSLCVKSVASCFELPLYRIDMIEIFSGRHGSPDGAFVEACRSVEAVAPAVVWFDEIEMGITAQTGEATADLGRIFAFFLTWMQEKARGLFIAATANRVDLLPAEMIRKGRFDEVFFVDLPTDNERIEIFRIHLQKRGLDASQFHLDRLKKFTKGWTGAEVEQCVVSALTSARLEDRPLADNDLLNVAATVVPLSKTMREQVDHIRSWAYDRAVRASPRESER
ncbi:MAG: AAA family ATPase [Deltaproteobacteria bacterium]|nr:AAA family ATPase [Deltaproteobacteria bacterium]